MWPCTNRARSAPCSTSNSTTRANWSLPASMPRPRRCARMLLAVTTSAPTNEQPARPAAGLSHRLPGLRPVFDEDHRQPCFPLGLAALSGGFDRHGAVSLQPVAFSAHTDRPGIFLPGQGGGGAG